MGEEDPRRILVPVRVPAWAGSLRFRLTVIYSSILFGLAALVVAGIYFGLATRLNREPMYQDFTIQQVTPTPEGTVVTSRQFRAQIQTFEHQVNARALEVLRNYSFAALVLLFFASLAVGWFVAGSALAPIHRITEVARDIQATDLKRRIALGGPPDELRELADTFDQMLERIDDAFESQRRFIQDASHELRNPLAVITTNLDVTLGDPDATVGDLRDTGRVVRDATARMSRLVDDLLVYARQEVPSLELQPVDVSEVVALTVAEFRAPADARNLVIESEARPELWVTGDRVALHQALANLLANAVRLAPAETRIRVAAGRHEGWVWFAVEDQGPGIPADVQPKVFQRFWRGAGQTTSGERRSGLGLAIVRQIAEAHHGEVRLASSEGEGSTFSIWIPEMAGQPVATAVAEHDA